MYDRPASKLLYDIDGEEDIKLAVVVTINGYKYYMIYYSCKEINYSDMIGLFTEMQNSINVK